MHKVLSTCIWTHKCFISYIETFNYEKCLQCDPKISFLFYMFLKAQSMKGRGENCKVYRVRRGYDKPL